jgi:hypothetical protein
LGGVFTKGEPFSDRPTINALDGQGILDAELIITIVKVGHRKDVYR